MSPGASACGEVRSVSFDSVVGIVVTLGLLIYLTIALLKPEKF